MPTPPPNPAGQPMAAFADPGAVARYAERTARMVPGLSDLHTMVRLLLAERAPEDARILVVGAGGELELKAFAVAQPRWQFDGVDPSAQMLALARSTLGPLAGRVRFHEGYLQGAPAGPFDGAACLLTLHFLDPADRRETLREIFTRLRPGAPLILAHHSFPGDDGEKDLWLARFAAFAVASGLSPAPTSRGIETMKARLPVLSPDQDEALMREAGFTGVTLFYAGFTFKGWVCHKP